MTRAPQQTAPIRQMRPGHFCWIDLGVIRQLPKIGPTAFSVYCVLAQHASSKTETCDPDEKTIASILRVSTKTVGRAITTLVAEKLITCQQVRQRGRWDKTTYTLLDVDRRTTVSPGDPDRQTNSSPGDASPSDISVPTVGQICPAPSDISVPTVGQICPAPSDISVRIQEPLPGSEPNVREPRKSAPASAGSPQNSKRIHAEDLPLPDSINTPVVRKAAGDWIAMRRKHRFSVRPEHISGQYERLVSLPPDQAAACLRYSTDNAYQGLFPEKFERIGHGTKQRVSDDRFEHDPNRPIASHL